jgi:hypothetical protein
MWRRLHLFSPVQSLVVASVSAATIALPLAAQLVSRNERALLRSLFWPDALDPYMTFSFVFIGVVPALLGYYHLGRLGFLLNVAAGFALAWIMAVCGDALFRVCGAFFWRHMAQHRCLCRMPRAGVHTHFAVPFKGRQVSIRARCSAKTPPAPYWNGLAVVTRGHYTQNPLAGVNECYGDISPLDHSQWDNAGEVWSLV